MALPQDSPWGRTISRKAASQCALPAVRRRNRHEHGLGCHRGLVGPIDLLARVVCPRLLRLVLAREGSGAALGQIVAGRRERQIDNEVYPVSHLQPNILAARRTISLAYSRMVV